MLLSDLGDELQFVQTFHQAHAVQWKWGLSLLA